MLEGKKLSKVKVSRFDPEGESEAKYSDYTVPYDIGNTVMDVLNYIHENLDGSLAYRMGCAGGGHQRCGACAMAVDGRPVLGCKALAKEEMTITPHLKFDVIRDLAIDFKKTRTPEWTSHAWVKITVDSNKCDGCRDCVFVCPMGVYELKKTGDKAISVPVDMVSCCGETCNQCAIFCKNSAITIKDLT
jgi:NAD-dependent dihydropyrimidine dehydrogenase PreA subunit